MKIVLLEAKDLDNLVNALRSSGYEIEEGPHAVLFDQSEVLEITLRKNSTRAGILIAHYITPYYRAETAETDNDEEYLRELIRIKHSGEKWSIPVNPIIIIAFDKDLLSILDSYSDKYPVPDGETLVENYKKRNPNHEEILRVLLARVLEKLSSG
ncbi:MAG: hypothetical protein ABWW65_02230 [Thermoprotei archaeon]